MRLILLLIGLLCASAAHAGDEPAGDFRSQLDQARFFLKKGWYQDARSELEGVVSSENGKLDAEAWFLLANVLVEMCDLEAARHAANMAHTHARTEAQLGPSFALTEHLRTQFGNVEIRTEHPGLGSRLTIAADGPLFDTDLKQYLSRVQTKLQADKVLLPYTLGLPVGAYVINGKKVRVQSSQTTTLMLSPTELGTSGIRLANQAKLELGAGGGLWFGRKMQHILPSFQLHGAWNQRLHGVDVAVMGTWAPFSYRTFTGTYETTAVGWSVGFRMGKTISNWNPIQMRVSAGYRFLVLQPLELNCTSLPSGSFSCGDHEDPELIVYPRSGAHAPLVELSMDYLERQRITSVGIGLKASLEYAIGRLPSHGEAERLDTHTHAEYTVESEHRAWGSLGLRLFANLTIAF